MRLRILIQSRDVVSNYFLMLTREGSATCFFRNKKLSRLIFESGTKEFRHQYTLMRHLPTHTDERNFKCDTCGKAFRQLSTLSQHKAIHSDARPYVCEFCKKTFNRYEMPSALVDPSGLFVFNFYLQECRSYK